MVYSVAEVNFNNVIWDPGHYSSNSLFKSLFRLSNNTENIKAPYHWSLDDSPQKGPGMRKVSPCPDITMSIWQSGDKPDLVRNGQKHTNVPSYWVPVIIQWGCKYVKYIIQCKCKYVKYIGFSEAHNAYQHNWYRYKRLCTYVMRMGIHDFGGRSQSNLSNHTLHISVSYKRLHTLITAVMHNSYWRMLWNYKLYINN